MGYFRYDSRYNKAGFCLTELLVVLGIAVIFAAISVPAISANVRKSAIQSTSSKIVNWISGLRQKSINEQVDITINKNSDGLTALANQEKLKKKFRTTSRSVPKDINLSITTNSIILFSSGTQTPSTIRLKNKDSICIIRLALRGRITSECS
jgi:Tfp pilus assembly protein FimT